MLKNFGFLNYFGASTPEKEVVEDDNKDNKIEETNQTESEKEQNQEQELLTITKAKGWGNYLFQVGKNATDIATKQTIETAKKIKDNVTDVKMDKNIIGKFEEEQTKFSAEKRTKEHLIKSVSGPWISDLSNDSESGTILRNKIFNVSNDERNFLRNPPPGNNFQFDYEAHTEVMMFLLKEDKKLNSMRFKLVPKKIKEELFWKNYFYRITLIKQSLDNSKNINHESETKADNEIENYEDAVDYVADLKENTPVKVTNQSGTMNSIQNVNNDQDFEDDELEAELQKELSEFELVNEDSGEIPVENDLLIDGSSLNTQKRNSDDEKQEYDDIEREILDELQRNK